MSTTNNTFAVYEFTESRSETEARAEEIRILGYTVVPAALDTQELGQAQQDRRDLPHIAGGHEQAAGAWHRDLNYQHFVSSRPLSVSALFCIDDFSATSGGTQVLPGSHKVEAFPSAAFTEQQAVQIEAPAGSVIVFDSMVYHRTGLNVSDAPRRAINHMYTVPFIKQQLDLPVLLGGKYEDDPWLGRLLGYESRPDESVKAFRVRRLARLER